MTEKVIQILFSNIEKQTKVLAYTGVEKPLTESIENLIGNCHPASTKDEDTWPVAEVIANEIIVFLDGQ